MRVLFAAFVLSLTALISTLIALKRHVRKHNAKPGATLIATQHEDSLKQTD
jgi:hypothetical protein